MWLSVVKTFTTPSEWPTGNGRNTNALIMPKTVVFAPIPRTRARNATIEKAGYLKSIRIAKRRSLIIELLRPQRFDWVNQSGAPGGEETSQQSSQPKNR